MKRIIAHAPKRRLVLSLSYDDAVMLYLALESYVGRNGVETRVVSETMEACKQFVKESRDDTI